MDPDNVNRPRVIPVVLHAANSIEFSQSEGPVLRRDREFSHSQPRVQGRLTALTAL
jgi:hypothetical protein